MSTKAIMTPKFRVSFPNLEKESKFGKYGVTMIFDGDDETRAAMEPMYAAIRALKAEKYGDKPPAKLRSPFRKGTQVSEDNPNGYDLEKYPEYEGKIIVSALNTIKPALRAPDCSVLADAREIYAGCYACAIVDAFWYSGKDAEGKQAGSPGFSFSLQAVQKMYEGERLSGVDVERAAGAFKPIAPAAVGNHSDLLDDDDF